MMFMTMWKNYKNISVGTVNRRLNEFEKTRLMDAASKYKEQIMQFGMDAYDKLEISDKIRNQFQIVIKRLVLNVQCVKGANIKIPG